MQTTTAIKTKTTTKSDKSEKTDKPRLAYRICCVIQSIVDRMLWFMLGMVAMFVIFFIFHLFKLL